MTKVLSESEALERLIYSTVSTRTTTSHTPLTVNYGSNDDSLRNTPNNNDDNNISNDISDDMENKSDIDKFAFEIKSNNNDDTCCLLFNIHIGSILISVWLIINAVLWFMLIYNNNNNKGHINEWMNKYITLLVYPKWILYIAMFFSFIFGISGLLGTIFKNKILVNLCLLWIFIKIMLIFCQGILLLIKGHIFCLIYFINVFIWCYWVLILDKFRRRLLPTKTIIDFDMNNEYYDPSLHNALSHKV